jgi:hypothetical protein
VSLMSSLSDYVEAYAPWSALMDERLHPVQYPQGKPGPWSVYKLVREDRDYSIDGPAEMWLAVVEWRLLSAVYDEAHELAIILSDRLDGYRGLMGDVIFTHIRWLDSRDGEVVDEVIGLYTVVCEISAWYRHQA